MPHSTLDDVWNGEDGIATLIEKIFKHEFNSTQYMVTYTTIYNYCTATRNSVPDTSRAVPGARNPPRGRGQGRHRQPTASETFIGGELYDRLRSIINEKVRVIHGNGCQMMGSEMLKYYEKAWRDYKFSISVLNGVCRYLNRHWVSREREERGDDSANSIYEIYDLGLIEWRDDMYKKLSKNLMSEIMKVIQKERNDESSMDNQLLLKKIIQESFVELGLKRKIAGKDSHEHDLHIYQDGFEQPFLKETEQYYQKESNEFISSNSVVDYLLKVEKRFEEEQRRVQTYLDNSTAKKVEGVCVKVLINAHITRLHEEFKVLLEQYKVSNLKIWIFENTRVL